LKRDSDRVRGEIEVGLLSAALGCIRNTVRNEHTVSDSMTLFSVRARY